MYQLEVGESGTPHFQGCFKLKSPAYFPTVKKWLPTAHLEPCKDWLASLKYCSKKDGRIDGPWMLGCSIPEEPDEEYTFKLSVLRPWQSEVLALCAEPPDDRKIHWYYDSAGGKGKTSLAKHICCNMKPALYVQGKSADIKSAIASSERKPKIVIFGLPRSLEDYVSYEAIESCKDGIFFSGKYESGMVMYAPPHVIIFANFLPDMTKLSADRWVIHHMDAPITFVSEPILSEAAGSAAEEIVSGNGLELSIASNAQWEEPT